MTIVYIAHPIGAPTQEGIEENLADLRRIVRFINLTFPDTVPLVPYYADVVSMDDNVLAERERGIKNDVAILESGLIQQFWLTGNRISNGMHAEREIAYKMKIPVVNLINTF